MSRKILPEQSISATALVSVPAGGRLIGVRGEADGKPTYDFVVIASSWVSDLPGILTCSAKHAGIRNGRKIDLWHEWPQIATTAIAPTTDGEVRITITPGTGVVLQVYYALGNVAV